MPSSSMMSETMPLASPRDLNLLDQALRGTRHLHQSNALAGNLSGEFVVAHEAFLHLLESLLDQPVAHQAGNVVAVAVHHHHVAVAANSHRGKIDRVGDAAGFLDGIRVGLGGVPIPLPQTRCRLR